MVKGFEEVVRKLSGKHSELCLFAVLKMDDLVDKWSVIISGTWSDDKMKRKEIFDDAVSLMTDEFDESELGSIARVGIFSQNEHLITLLSKYKKGTSFDNEKINGNQIFEGYILESKSCVA
ncbi:hypothetical protein JW899_00995 [Candidatus Uhrbacteria bacterium]|nr:hypothetical protein [Candidatus Uhrbacteria bacterium]